VLEGHAGAVGALRFAPLGVGRSGGSGAAVGAGGSFLPGRDQLLASCSDDDTVRVWDCATGSCAAALEGHTGRVVEAAWAAHGCLLASTSADGTVRTWARDARGAWGARACLRGRPGAAATLALSPDASQVMGIAQWAGRGQGQGGSARSRGGSSAIAHLARAPRLPTVAAAAAATGRGGSGGDCAAATSGGGDGVDNACVWDVATGAVVARYSHVLAAAWWAGAPAADNADDTGNGGTSDTGGECHSRSLRPSAGPPRLRFVVATPETLQVLPPPGADAAAGAPSSVPDAEAFYDVGTGAAIALGTGDARALSFAVAEGERLMLYNLQLSCLPI
jgi:hypothetical protein